MKAKEPMSMEDKIEIIGRIAIIIGLIIFFGTLIGIAFCIHPFLGILVTGGVIAFSGCMICSM